MAESVKFQISTIRTELEQDFARYSGEIRAALETCLKSGGTALLLAEVIHAAHAIRGVSSLVGAWALAFWCEDMERLARAATQDLKSDPDRANLVIRFLYDHRNVMSKLGRMSLAEDFDNALSDYAGIRSRMPLVVRELTSAKEEGQGIPIVPDPFQPRPPSEPRRSNLIPNGRKTNNLPLPPSARRPGEGAGPPKPSFSAARAPAIISDDERRPYLAEARFYLARVDGILRTDVMPAKTADLWNVLARLFSSLEFYCLTLGNARILELVDKAQQLTLRAVEDRAARTEGTRLALAEYHLLLGGEFDAQESGQPEIAPVPVPVTQPESLTKRFSRPKNRNRVVLPELLGIPPTPSDLRLVHGKTLPAEVLDPGLEPEAKPVLEITAPVPKPPVVPDPVVITPPILPTGRRPLLPGHRPPVVAQTSPLIALRRKQTRRDFDADPRQTAEPVARKVTRPIELSEKETTPVVAPPPPRSNVAPPDLTERETTPITLVPPPRSKAAPPDAAEKETTPVIVPPPPRTPPNADEEFPRPMTRFKTPTFEELSGPPARPSTTPNLPPAPLDEAKAESAPDTGLAHESGDPELIGIFLPEARELLDDSESALLAWENGEDIEDKQRLLRRHLHTLKGAANSIGLTLLGGNVHILEEFVTSRPAAEMRRTALDRLLGCVDEAREFISELEQHGTAPWRADWSNLDQAQTTPSDEVPSPPVQDMEGIFTEVTPAESVPVETESILADDVPPGIEHLAISPPECENAADLSPAPEPVAAELSTVEAAVPVATAPEAVVPADFRTMGAELEEEEDGDLAIDDPEMRTIFLDELQTLLEDFDRGVREWCVEESAEGGRQRVRRTMHTLRGASLSLGMGRLGECSLNVEAWVNQQPAAIALPDAHAGALREMLAQGHTYLDKLRADEEDDSVLNWVTLMPAPIEPASSPDAVHDPEVSESETEAIVEPAPEAETAPEAEPASAEVLAEGSDEPPISAASTKRPEPTLMDREEWDRLVAESESKRRVSPKPPPKKPAEEAPRREQVLLQVDAKSLRGLLDITGELIIDRHRFDRNLALLRDFRKGLAENRDRLLQTITDFQKEFEYTAGRRRAQSRILGNGKHRAPDLPEGLFTGPVPPEQPAGRALEEFSELEFDRYDQFNVLTRVLQELVNDINEIGQGMERVTDTLSHENVEFAKMSRLLQDELASLNMLNFNGLFRRMQRTFRDALQVEGKEAQIRFEGEETRLDRVILEKLYAPLMHLVRNSVAHGLESADDRRAAGKPEQGVVILRAHQLSHQVIIEITDDGRGIDPGKVRRKAVDRGLIPADHAELNWEELLDLLFTPGFSTAEQITSLAGRGVGLDVVKRDVEDMNGSLRLHSELGKYCRWTIQLPLTLSAADAALIRVGGQVFALPLSYVDGGVHMAPEEVVDQDGQTFYQRGEELIPLRELGELMGLNRPVPQMQQAVILNTGGFRAAIAVERLIGREQIVIKSLGPFLREHPLYSGATLDAEGKAVLILNVPHLAAIVRAGQLVAPASAPIEVEESSSLDDDRSLHVLVVDDSLSVRKSLEKHLVRLDCEVTLATDGVDAMEKMRNALFDVIFTDLEMPNMDGFQLLVEARGLELWANVPIYVVTSRAVDKYTQKATALGATGFLSKPVSADQLRDVLQSVRGEAMAETVRSV